MSLQRAMATESPNKDSASVITWRSRRGSAGGPIEIRGVKHDPDPIRGKLRNQAGCARRIANYVSDLRLDPKIDVIRFGYRERLPDPVGHVLPCLGSPVLRVVGPHVLLVVRTTTKS